MPVCSWRDTFRPRSKTKKATHPTRNTKYIVIYSKWIDANWRRTCAESHLEVDTFNTTHVDTARWLVLFRLQSEAVQVDSDGRNTRVVVVRLQQVVVRRLARSDTVVSVERNLGVNHWVVSTVWVRTSSIVSEIHPAICTSGNIRIGLNNPDQFFDRMREIQLLPNARVRVRFGTVRL